MIYYSKVLYTLLSVVFIVFFGPLIPNYINDGFNNMFLMTLALIILFGLILHMFFNTTYKIQNENFI